MMTVENAAFLGHGMCTNIARSTKSSLSSQGCTYLWYRTVQHLRAHVSTCWPVTLNYALDYWANGLLADYIG